mmetsp:Transcript_11384/g.25997  ORF Transcript_11384/g.25997 Transcript_11384/m.25997 type:complete len:247 (+) Transcript_11384:275-1015(+)
MCLPFVSFLPADVDLCSYLLLLDGSFHRLFPFDVGSSAFLPIATSSTLLLASFPSLLSWCCFLPLPPLSCKSPSLADVSSLSTSGFTAPFASFVCGPCAMCSFNSFLFLSFFPCFLNSSSTSLPSSLSPALLSLRPGMPTVIPLFLLFSSFSSSCRPSASPLLVFTASFRSFILSRLSSSPLRLLAPCTPFPNLLTCCSFKLPTFSPAFSSTLSSSSACEIFVASPRISAAQGTIFLVVSGDRLDR